MFDKEMGDGHPGRLGRARRPGGGTAAPAGAPPPPAAGSGGQPPAARRHPVVGQTPPFETTGKVMTAGGTFTATLVLFVLLLAGGWFGWHAVHTTASCRDRPIGATPTAYNIHIPGWIWIAGWWRSAWPW